MKKEANYYSERDADITMHCLTEANLRILRGEFRLNFDFLIGNLYQMLAEGKASLIADKPNQKK